MAAKKKLIGELLYSRADVDGIVAVSTLVLRYINSMYNILPSASFLSVFLASLAGSLHCLGICGGLVVLSGSQKSAPIVGQLQYHIGRGISYVLLGVLASYFGESLISYFSNDSLKYLAPLSIVAVFLVAYTIKMRVPRAESYYAIGGTQKSGIITKLFTISAKLPFALGLLTIFLPCGWLYSFVLLAAGSGSEVSGAKVMLAFWLGTLPALLVAGTVFEGTVRALSKKYTLLPLILVVVAATISVTLRITPSKHNHGGEVINTSNEMALPEKCIH